MPLTEVLRTGRFDPEVAAQAPGWLQTLRGEEIPETEEYGVRHFVVRSDRPFHPARLARELQAGFAGVLRSKGFFWIASRNDLAGEWSLAGRVLSIGPAGMWWSAVPEAERAAWFAEMDPADVPDLGGPFGDRRQELVFIGDAMDEQEIRGRLARALLTDDELAEGPEAWARYEDPLPRWGMAEAEAAAA